jgi:hypothetical protein
MGQTKRTSTGPDFLAQRFSSRLSFSRALRFRSLLSLSYPRMVTPLQSPGLPSRRGSVDVLLFDREAWLLVLPALARLGCFLGAAGLTHGGVAV